MVYALIAGENTGLYNDFTTVTEKSKGHSGSIFKRFASKTDATNFLNLHSSNGEQRYDLLSQETLDKTLTQLIISQNPINNGAVLFVNGQRLVDAAGTPHNYFAFTAYVKTKNGICSKHTVSGRPSIPAGIEDKASIEQGLALMQALEWLKNRNIQQTTIFTNANLFVKIATGTMNPQKSITRAWKNQYQRMQKIMEGKLEIYFIPNKVGSRYINAVKQQALAAKNATEDIHVDEYFIHLPLKIVGNLGTDNQFLAECQSANVGITKLLSNTNLVGFRLYSTNELALLELSNQVLTPFSNFTLGFDYMYNLPKSIYNEALGVAWHLFPNGMPHEDNLHVEQLFDIANDYCLLQDPKLNAKTDTGEQAMSSYKYLEGIIRRGLIKIGITYPTTTHSGRQNYNLIMFNHNHLKSDYAGGTVAQRDYLGRAYSFFATHRHVFAHSNEPGVPVVTDIPRTKALIETTSAFIDEYYSIFQE
ncbi:ribonuclease H1 domain-containing protein [Lactiplantibacillus plantarum]|uniref:ribonuclease H1 domain-containing protein n=1 Tax=Lactiplantibacillus plantarum TaxID=1590 RepID=UPI003F65DC57